MIKELEKIGIKAKTIIHNPTYDKIIEDSLKKGEVEVTSSGATAVDTGEFTGRSPKDKYFVNQHPSNQYIAWGKINQPISLETFKELEKFTKNELSNKEELYVIDVFVGASKESRRAIRFITPIAWQAHFVMNMFILPIEEEKKDFKPDFVFLVAGEAKFDKYKEFSLNSDIFVAFNIESNLAVMSGTKLR